MTSSMSFKEHELTKSLRLFDIDTFDKYNEDIESTSGGEDSCTDDYSTHIDDLENPSMEDQPVLGGPRKKALNLKSIGIFTTALAALIIMIGGVSYCVCRKASEASSPKVIDAENRKKYLEQKSISSRSLKTEEYLAAFHSFTADVHRVGLEESKTLIKAKVEERLAEHFQALRVSEKTDEPGALIDGCRYEFLGVSFYGSSVTGLFLEGSDIDISVNVRRCKNHTKLGYEEVVKVLEEVQKALKNVAQEIHPVTLATVPVMEGKLFDRHIDFSVNNDLAIRNSELLGAYFDNYPAARMLAQMVKFGTSASKMVFNYHEKNFDAFQNYTYSLMVIHFLQLQKALPDLQDCGTPASSGPLSSLYGLAVGEASYQKPFHPEMVSQFCQFYLEKIEDATRTGSPYVVKATEKETGSVRLFNAGFKKNKNPLQVLDPIAENVLNAASAEKLKAGLEVIQEKSEEMCVMLAEKKP